MEQQQEHLSDAQIEQCAKQPPGSCPRQMELHLSECEHCLESLLKWQRIHLQRFEVMGMRQEPYPECPDDSKIKEVAAGNAHPEAGAEILEHAAQCDHCGPLLSQYLEILSVETSPEIEALIDQMPSSKPGWEKKKAREIVRRQKPVPTPAPPWWRLVLQPRILAGTASLASLAIVAIFWVPPAVETWQLKKSKTLVAEAFTEDRVTPMRFTGVPHASYRPTEGKMGTQDGAEELKHPALMKALTNLSEKLSSGKVDPRVLQMEGRLLLLKDPANQEAKTAFLEAQGEGLNDPSLEIDLAVSYFEHDTRNVPPGNRIPNLSNSIDLLTKVLTYPNLTKEQRAVALFNLAVAYEKSKSCQQAKDTWDKYLEMDRSGSWADEARSRREEDQNCLRPSQGGLQATPDPAVFLAHLQERAVQENAEEYLETAASAWIPDAMSQPEGPSSRAYSALADLLKKNTLIAC